MKKYDFSIVGKEVGRWLLDGNLPDQLTVEMISFLEFPNSAKKQTQWANVMKEAIKSGELKVSQPQ